MSWMLLGTDGASLCLGVMNLLWVAGLSVLLLLEKISPASRMISQLSGLLFIAWATWIAFS